MFVFWTMSLIWSWEKNSEKIVYGIGFLDWKESGKTTFELCK